MTQTTTTTTHTSDAADTIIRVLRALRGRRGESRALWAMAVAGADDPAAAREDRHEAMASWGRALEACRLGDFSSAIEALELARSLAQDWGDDGPEAAAIEAMQGTEEGVS